DDRPGRPCQGACRWRTPLRGHAPVPALGTATAAPVGLADAGRNLDVPGCCRTLVRLGGPGNQGQMARSLFLPAQPRPLSVVDGEPRRPDLLLRDDTLRRVHSLVDLPGADRVERRG